MFEPNLTNWGQHFLVDQQVIKEFIHACELEPEQTVLEIGPGQGALTREIVKRVKQLDCVEIDKRLAPYLANYQVYFQNILKWKNFNYDLICGALSYSLFEPLMVKLVNNPDFKVGVFIVSYKVKEVFIARSGALYNLLNPVFKVNFGEKILPAAFSSKPRTASVIVKLVRKLYT